MTFEELNISEPILKALDDKNYIEPTPIQEQAIPEASQGRDILGIAQTGTGKTAAFAIPIIEQLMTLPNGKGRKTIKALVLTPTRELAIQIEESFADYGRYTKLKQGTDIMIATPGRLLDLIGQGIIRLDNIRHFVLDEADRMLDMGFIHDIRKLLPLLPKKKQTMLFSATMPNEIAKISKSLLNNPHRIEIAPVSSVVDTMQQHVCYLEKPKKMDALVQLLNQERNERVLIFSRTKHGADRIAKNLTKKKIMCGAIHGNKSQNARQKALNDFKTGKTNVIVATDIAARGIDIQDLGIVVNYDLPDVPETYVHRIGRTGRAGNSGVAFTFCTQEETPMLRSIQKLTGKKLSQVSIPA